MQVLAHPRVTSVRPFWAIEGGRVSILGNGFEVGAERLPQVLIGERPARVVRASPEALDVIVPAGLEGGATAVRIEGVPGETAVLDVGGTFATGLHQVDNPVFDAQGHLYVTYSGTRGQEVPVSVFRVTPSGTRETFLSGIVNPTSMAFSRQGVLHVSSRFEGTVYKVVGDGTAEPFVTDLGVACGLAFDPGGDLYVGDRSGTIFRVTPAGRASPFASLPPSVAAFHLAFGPGGVLYASAPTLSAYDVVYRIDRSGEPVVAYSPFGRPQGLAFDASGNLYVVEALAGASGLYRIAPGGTPELVLAGPGLVGVAIDPSGGLVVASNETAYRLPVSLRPWR